MSQHAYTRIGEARRLVEDLAQDNPELGTALGEITRLLSIDVPEPSQAVVEAIFRDGEAMGYRRARRELGVGKHRAPGRPRRRLNSLPAVVSALAASGHAPGHAARELAVRSLPAHAAAPGATATTAGAVAMIVMCAAVGAALIAETWASNGGYSGTNQLRRTS